MGDWDEEMDGEWEAPTIDNPEYKGEWVHPQVANPEYEHDDALYDYADFGVIGLDLWQVKSGTIFDSILITDDEAEYTAAVEAFKTMKEGETKMKDEEEAKKKAEEEAKKAEEGEGEARTKTKRPRKTPGSPEGRA